ncbi:MAG TPA: hypothetical protein VGH28_04190 [Polyangiaceae bacterium]|jgi:hypothetical protein
MKRIALAVAAVAALSGCSKPESSSASVASASAAPAPPPPFTGKLTSERVMGAKGLVHPFMPWSEAGPKLEGQLGKPTHIKESTQMWAVNEGDDCWYVEVEKRADGTVGMVQQPAKISKGEAAFNWDDCLTAANVPREGEIDDPNAPGPPTDGKPITVAALLDGASKARAKWTNAKVTVKGVYSGTSRSSSGDSTSTTISMMNAKDSGRGTSCRLEDPNAVPEKLGLATPLTATGVVTVDNMVTLGGTRSVSVSLDHCVVKVSAGK